VEYHEVLNVSMETITGSLVKCYNC
jgi:hypothetical protein